MSTARPCTSAPPSISPSQNKQLLRGQDVVEQRDLVGHDELTLHSRAAGPGALALEGALLLGRERDRRRFVFREARSLEVEARAGEAMHGVEARESDLDR